MLDFSFSGVFGVLVHGQSLCRSWSIIQLDVSRHIIEKAAILAAYSTSTYMPVSLFLFKALLTLLAESLKWLPRITYIAD